MARYFLELKYMGGAYGGFQKQENANTIQAELEKALAVYFREPVQLTGSSRTDKGVHARQNYFHADMVEQPDEAWERHRYHLNAILPADIVLLSVKRMSDAAHCRFDAVYREYVYRVYAEKDPFLADRAYYYPFKINRELMQEAAQWLLEVEDFKAFSKHHSQVSHYRCHLMKSVWQWEDGCWVYRVRGNRFLRGMVRGMVGTMLRVGRGKIDLTGFQNLVAEGNAANADFSVPGHGLTLWEVGFGKTGRDSS